VKVLVVRYILIDCISPLLNYHMSSNGIDETEQKTCHVAKHYCFHYYYINLIDDEIMIQSY